ncbi:pentatricopeptide repeat-containing protein At5g66631 [Aristolochia californica]|uniref:pentatricopeptide repeat-containing protein At5g66631 n=1 Tax=Aristolochia californica TaxID=171875 RepID=UPI0035DECC66
MNQVAIYLHRARLIDAIRVHLRTNATRSLDRLLPCMDSFIATQALRCAPSPDSALSFFHLLKKFTISNPQNNLLSQSTVHAMAKRLSLSGRLLDLHTLISAMNASEFPAVLPPSPMDLLRWYAASNDLDSTTNIFSRICSEASSKNQRHPCTEAYNIMMNLYAKNGHDRPAVMLFLRMIEEGANPNSRTYTIVIEHLLTKGKPDAAMEVFEKLPSMRVRRTSRQYLVLANALSAVHRYDAVKNLLLDMQSDGILLRRSLQSAIEKLRDAGYVEETGKFVQDFEPDKRIKSMLFSTPNRDDDNDDNDDDEEEEEDDENAGGLKAQLKPWLDPSALASALSDWNPSEVSVLEDAKFVWTSRLVCKLLRSFKKPDSAWEFFCWVALQPGGFTHDIYTVSRMIVILARHGRVEFVDRLISKIKRERICLSFSTLRLVIDYYGLSKEADAAMRVFREMGSICGTVSKINLRLLYSSLLRTLVKCKRSSEVVDFLDEMVLLGILPDIQTFCGLIQYFALEGDLRMVQHLFGMVRQSAIEPDAFMYQILIRAYCRKERAALALRVFDDMWTRGLKPDMVTKGLLVKSLWKEGRLREAASVEERCEEVKDGFPVAVPGHVWTVSSEDLERMCMIYSSCFLKDGG